MAAFRQASGADLLCAIKASIWRSSVTICSALNLFFGITRPFPSPLSHDAWPNKARLDLEFVIERRVVSAVSGVGNGALGGVAGHSLHRLDYGGKRVAAISSPGHLIPPGLLSAV
jgi:hypothetical protein